jgi:hypothetical protein
MCLVYKGLHGVEVKAGTKSKVKNNKDEKMEAGVA